MKKKADGAGTRVAHIRIRNILGIETLDIVPGRATVVSGRNAQGKTSIVEAIKSVLAGGAHDATLLRNGASEGEVVLELADGTTLRKTVTAEKSKLAVRHPEFGNVSAVSGYLRAHFDGLSVNPIEFLTASPARRSELLIESLPMEVTAEDFADPIFDDFERPTPGEGHALDAIAALRRAIYDARTGETRSIRERDGLISRLSETIPVGVVIVGEEELAALRAGDALALLAAREAAETVRAERVQGIRDVDAWEAAEIERVRAEARTLRRNAEDATAERLGAAREEIARLEAVGERRAAEVRAIDEYRRTLATIEHATREREEIRVAVARLTAGIEALDALKIRLMSRLPFAGVELRDGDIFVEGVPFDRLNRATQVKIAIGLARHRAGDVPLVIVDGLECLDPETFALFVDRARDSDVQMIVTRVTDGALSIEAIE